METAHVSPPVKPTYNESLSEITRIINSRRGGWTYLSLMPWDDVRQECFLRAFVKWHLFDPAKGPLENWLNTLISGVFHNLRRDLVLRLARPCIGGFTGRANGKHCEFNTGGDTCSFTPSGLQCAQCPVYAKWQRERQHQHNLKSQVSLENHVQEVHNRPDESLDVVAIRDWLHTAMLAELSRWEGRIYRLSIMADLPPVKVAAILAREVAKRKRPPRPDEGYSYSAVVIYNRTFRGMMRQLLLREGHIGPEHMDPNRNRHHRRTPPAHG